MADSSIDTLNAHLGDPAGDLRAEMAQLSAIRDINVAEARSIHTAFSTFPNCCSLAEF